MAQDKEFKKGECHSLPSLREKRLTVIVLFLLVLPALSACETYSRFSHSIAEKMPTYGGARCEGRWFCFGGSSSKPKATVQAQGNRRSANQSPDGQNSYSSGGYTPGAIQYDSHGVPVAGPMPGYPTPPSGAPGTPPMPQPGAAGIPPSMAPPGQPPYAPPSGTVQPPYTGAEQLPPGIAPPPIPPIPPSMMQGNQGKDGKQPVWANPNPPWKDDYQETPINQMMRDLDNPPPVAGPGP